jgi:hypothetical protein
MTRGDVILEDLDPRPRSDRFHELAGAEPSRPIAHGCAVKRRE